MEIKNHNKNIIRYHNNNKRLLKQLKIITYVKIAAIIAVKHNFKKAC